MFQNAYLLAKIGADTAENERNFAENFAKIGNYPTGPLTYGSGRRPASRRSRAPLGRRRPRSRGAACRGAAAGTRTYDFSNSESERIFVNF